MTVESQFASRTWSLRAYHPAVFDAHRSEALLRQAAKSNRLAAGARDWRACTLAAVSYLGSPAALVTLKDVLLETDDSLNTRRYLDSIEGSVQDAKQSFVELQGVLAQLAQDPSVDQATPELAPYRTQLARSVRQPQNPESRRWSVVAETYGFDAMAEVHRAAVRRSFAQTATVDDAEITHENWRALLSSADTETRRKAWRRRLRAADEGRVILEPTKQARRRFAGERARLLGFDSVLDRELTVWRVEERTLNALRALDSRSKSLADRYYRYKKARLRLSDFGEYDILAPTTRHSSEEVSFERLLAVLEEELAECAPNFADVLRHLIRGETILTDPGSSRSSGWFALAGPNGVLPLVHIPYCRTTECYAAAAHELGHACHLGELVHSRGELVGSDDSLVFQETFALHFEITALRSALRRARDANSVRYWREALIEQALHFLRTLPIMAHFEDDVERGDEASSAWHAAHARLTPSWMGLPTANDASWLLQTNSEQMPYFGYAYQLAFLLGYLTTFRPSSIVELANRGPWMPIEGAARAAVGRDISDTAAFNPIYEFVETLMRGLENDA